MALKTLFMREIKALLRNPGFIISLVLIIVFYIGMGRAVGVAVETAAREVQTSPIGVVDMSRDIFSEKVLEVLNTSLGGRLYYVDSVSSGLEKYSYVLVIPENFSSLVETGHARVDLYTRTERIGGFIGADMAGVLTNQITSAVTSVLAREQGISIENVSKRVLVSSVYMIGGREVRGEVFGALTGFVSLASFVTALVVSMSGAFSAQLMAFEKVEKAFEMLMAQPIPRREIVLAKILGSLVSSVIMGVTYMSGLLGMALAAAPQGGEALSTGTGTLLPAVVSATGPIYLVLVGLVVVLGVLYVGSLGVIIGMLVSDERTAGVVAGPIIMLFIGIGYVFMLVGASLSHSAAVLAGLSVVGSIPYIAVGLVAGDYVLVYTPLVTMAVVSLVLVLVAFRLIERDIVVLGLRIGGLRRRPL